MKKFKIDTDTELGKKYGLAGCPVCVLEGWLCSMVWNHPKYTFLTCEKGHIITKEEDAMLHAKSIERNRRLEAK